MIPGERVAGNLQHVADIARGGFATVHLAVRREGNFERLYAIKRPRAHLLEDEGVQEMFLHEARVAGMLRHPNVVPVQDVGEDRFGPFLRMPFVDGVPVGTLCAMTARQDDLLPVSVVVAIAAQIAAGLSAAHRLCDHEGVPAPLVHRDVSPQNVLVSFEGTAYLTDFGIAKVISSGDTTKDMLKGKVAYMAPEQLRFERPTPKTDLYALGVVLYEMLACKRLYEPAEMAEIAEAVLRGAPPDIHERRSDVPPELEVLLLKLLAKDANARPESALRVEETLRSIGESLKHHRDHIDLATFLDEGLSNVREARLEERRAALESARQGPPSKRRWPIYAAAGVAAAAAVTMLVWSAAGDTGPSAAPEARAPSVAAPPPPEPAVRSDRGPSDAPPSEASLPAADPPERSEAAEDALADGAPERSSPAKRRRVRRRSRAARTPSAEPNMERRAEGARRVTEDWW
ncbi:MAG: serine/threonine-protein kinase [Myxococcota bacterium]